MGGAPGKTQASWFHQGASITILTAYLLLSFLEVISPSPSSLNSTLGVSSILPYPTNLIINSLIMVFCLLGIYGVATGNSFGIYFALLTPSWEMMLGGITLSRNSQINTLTFRSLSLIILGAISIRCTLKLHTASSIWEEAVTEPIASIKAGETEYAVEVVDLFKEYVVGPVVVPAINGLSLKVKRGEFISVMGPSGCGKSTLLNLIGALDRPTSGRVLIDGVDLSTMDDRALARLRNEKIGFVFQAYNLINRSTVFRNVELPLLVKSIPREERARRVMEMLRVVGLEDKANMRPKMLSGGEQQRVAIARALINRPSIILADEPTGNLDSKSGRNVIGFMRKLNREFGTTIIVVTHDREVAEMTDRIIYLRDGRIIGEELRKAD